MSYLPMVSWCATMVYPEKRWFTFGNITLPSNAKQHEVEEALMKGALEHMPEGFQVLCCKRGSVFFVPGDPQL